MLSVLFVEGRFAFTLLIVWSVRVRSLCLMPSYVSGRSLRGWKTIGVNRGFADQMNCLVQGFEVTSSVARGRLTSGYKLGRSAVEGCRLKGECPSRTALLGVTGGLKIDFCTLSSPSMTGVFDTLRILFSVR